MRADDDLLVAYCDGVTELTTEERKRVEALLAADPALRTDETATRELLSTLRELPAEGAEPDWTAMERAIRAEVGPDVPRQWWRPVWRWLVPATSLAMMATIAVLAFGGQRSAAVREPIALHDAGVAIVVPAPLEPAITEITEISDVAMRLDGEDIVIEADDEEALDVDDMLLGEGDAHVDGLLTTGELVWIDELDDDDAEFAEKWLDERKKS